MSYRIYDDTAKIRVKNWFGSEIGLGEIFTSQLFVSAVLTHLSKQFRWTNCNVPLHLHGVISAVSVELPSKI